MRDAALPEDIILGSFVRAFYILGDESNPIDQSAWNVSTAALKELVEERDALRRRVEELEARGNITP